MSLSLTKKLILILAWNDINLGINICTYLQLILITFKEIIQKIMGKMLVSGKFLYKDFHCFSLIFVCIS